MYKTTERIIGAVSALLKIVIILIFVFPFLWMISISLQSSAEISSFSEAASILSVMPAVAALISL